MKSTGPTFCWVCNRRLMLATIGEHKGRFVWTVVADRDDNEHRVHKQCAREADGTRFVREDFDAEMKPQKLRVWI